MTKKFNIAQIIILGFLVFLIGCTEKIEFDLNEGQNERLVVDAWITDEGGIQPVYLTLSTSYYQSEEPPRVDNATIILIQNELEISLNMSEPGIYNTPESFAPSIGDIFTLKIQYKNETFEATEELKSVTAIDSLGYDRSDEFEQEEEGERYVVQLYAQEPEGLGDGYFFKSYPTDSVEIGEDITWGNWANDDFVDGNYIDGLDIGYADYEIGDTAIVEMLSITKETSEFFDAIMLETEWRGSPFDTPPANVPSNISNGALGRFIISAIVKDSIVIEE